MDKTKHIAGDLFDKISIRKFRRKQRNVLFEAGAGGLEAFDFEFQERQTLEECVFSLEAVPTIYCVISEIIGKTRTDKQDKGLSGQLSPIMNGSTQHGWFFIRGNNT